MAIFTTGNTVGLTSQEHRNQTAVTLPPFKTALGVRGGTHSGLAIKKTSGMGFTIAPGRAAVEPASPSAGPYVVTVSAAETLAFAPGDSTRDRIDLVCVKVDETTGTEDAASIVIVKGAYPASGAAVRPSIPAAHEALYAVPIPAAMSAGSGGWVQANAVDMRRNLVSNGSAIPVNSIAERNALASYEGMQVMRLDLNGSVDRFVNNRWVGNTEWINLDMDPGWVHVASFTKMRVKLTADGNLAMLAGEVKYTGTALPSEGMIVGRIPANAMAAGLVPEERSFVMATDDTYRGVCMLTITPNGYVRIGPYPTGRVFMFYGTFPVQAS